MFAAALAMAMTCPKKRGLDLEPHATAKTTTSNHFFQKLLLCGCDSIMKTGSTPGASKTFQPKGCGLISMTVIERAALGCSALLDLGRH